MTTYFCEANETQILARGPGKKSLSLSHWTWTLKDADRSFFSQPRTTGKNLPENVMGSSETAVLELRDTEGRTRFCEQCLSSHQVMPETKLVSGIMLVNKFPFFPKLVWVEFSGINKRKSPVWCNSFFFPIRPNLDLHRQLWINAKAADEGWSKMPRPVLRALEFLWF